MAAHNITSETSTSLADADLSLPNPPSHDEPSPEVQGSSLCEGMALQNDLEEEKENPDVEMEQEES